MHFQAALWLEADQNETRLSESLDSIHLFSGELDSLLFERNVVSDVFLIQFCPGLLTDVLRGHFHRLVVLSVQVDARREFYLVDQCIKLGANNETFSDTEINTSQPSLFELSSANAHSKITEFGGRMKHLIICLVGVHCDDLSIEPRVVKYLAYHSDGEQLDFHVSNGKLLNMNHRLGFGCVKISISRNWWFTFTSEQKDPLRCRYDS